MTTQNFGTHFVRNISQYVPSMGYDAVVRHGGIVNVDLGTPIAADADGILNDQSIATVAVVTTFAATYDVVNGLSSKFGRNLTAVASGAATSTVTITGRDYIGQRMTETLTLNGTTTVAGLKAFKWIDSVTFTTTAGTTIDLGWGDVFGLPYKAIARLTGTDAADYVATTAGTFVAGLATGTTMTATTGDPRGTYDPNAAANGTLRFSAAFLFDTNNLHGSAHYVA